jgi:phage shock protein A
MNLFDRLSNLTKATLHEVLNKVEDPIMMTGQYLRNLEEDISAAEGMLKQQKMTVSTLERKAKDAEEDAKKSELNALTALQAGNESLAHQSAAGKIHFEEEAAKYAAEAEEVRSNIVELEIRLQEGKEEYTRLKEKQSELAARARKAKERAQAVRPNFSRGIESGDAARGFQRMEEKILEWEAGAEVSSQPFTTSNNVSSATVEDDSAVREEIQRLKNKLSSK